MVCTWQEEQAYRFVDGSLEPEDLRSFTDHLSGCDTCRERVSQAERWERLLTASVTPVPAPPSLAGRIAGAVAAERESRPRFAWRLPFGRRFASVAAALLLVVGLVTIAAGPATVMAVVQRALLFVPGIGISATDGDSLVAAHPVSVKQGDVTLTVEALLSDGEHTEVKFTVKGLPGGKEGWNSEKPVPAEKDSRVGDIPPQPPAGPRRTPVLRDETGREYQLQLAGYGTGGSREENRIEGEMYFAPLAQVMGSVDLIVPVEYLVPSTVLPGADTQEWVAHIPLVHPAESGLPQAVQQSSTATVDGVTLRVIASALEDGRTVVLVAGEAPGGQRVVGLTANGHSSGDALILKDNLGRTYKHIPSGTTVTRGDTEVQQSLYFEPLQPLASELTLSVAAVQVVEEGEAEVTIPLAGLEPDGAVALDRVVELGGHEVLLKSATLVQQEPWLFVTVDLGPEVDGRMLSNFSVDAHGSWISSSGAKEGSQMDQFGVQLEPGQSEVKLQLRYPSVTVEGPWVLTFPAGGN